MRATMDGDWWYQSTTEGKVKFYLLKWQAVSWIPNFLLTGSELWYAGINVSRFHPYQLSFRLILHTGLSSMLQLIMRHSQASEWGTGAWISS